MPTSRQPSAKRGEAAFIFAIVLGLVLGILIKRIRVGMIIGIVLGLLILWTGWLRSRPNNNGRK